MSILIGKGTRLVLHGIASGEGTACVESMLTRGTRVAAGVTFGQGGTWHASIPVFDTVGEAVRATDANASLICVPPNEAAEAILEAADAGLALIICTSADVPIHDMVLVRAYLDRGSVSLIGPDSAGVFSPGTCLAGLIPDGIAQPGSVGVVSRSSSLAYEIVWLLTQAGFGQSTIVGIGSGPIIGTGLAEILEMFEGDPLTEQVVIIGEIGSQEEEHAAALVADQMTKPVVAYIAGQTAPAGRQMGHAGAIIETLADTAQHKIEALSRAGVRIARSPSEIPELLERRST